jgi:hypothetical protein
MNAIASSSDWSNFAFATDVHAVESSTEEKLWAAFLADPK